MYKKCAPLNTVYVQYLQGGMLYNGNLNSWSNIYLCVENPVSVHKVPVYDLKVGVWCVQQARTHSIIVSIFF